MTPRERTYGRAARRHPRNLAIVVKRRDELAALPVLSYLVRPLADQVAKAFRER